MESAQAMGADRAKSFEYIPGETFQLQNSSSYEYLPGHLRKSLREALKKDKKIDKCQLRSDTPHPPLFRKS